MAVGRSVVSRVEFRIDYSYSRWTVVALCLSYVTLVYMGLLRNLRLSLTILCRRYMASPITVPEGFTLHTENTSHILLPSNNEAFLNPVQEFNRDISVAAIRVWSEELNKKKEERWGQARGRRQKKAGKLPAPDRKRSKLEDEVVQET